MVKGIFQYRKSRRLAEIEVNGQIIDAYVSNGVEMDFLKPGTDCFLRMAESETRRTAYDLYSVYDHDTLVCIDAKEPLRIAKGWYTERLQNEFPGERVAFIEDTRSSFLMGCLGATDKMTVQIMGTSFVRDRAAFLPVIRSNALNERLESLLWAKTQGEPGSDPRLLIVACRDDVDSFCANADVDPYFAELFNEVQEADILVECLRCTVDEDGMRADSLIPCVC